ncbi:MAG: ATP-binding cassette domain-containing protein [Archangiaceae bacterium]|nr:ATP-binding cassette domain-containing protein [Archangiaceae bacterium]
MTVMAARRLGFERPSGVVLADITLTVGEGERVALIGENGAGKSTLLRLLLGLERPSRGIVHPAPRGCGYVPQAAGESLFPWFTVLKNVALPRLAANLPGAAEVAWSCLREVAPAIDPGRRAAALSGGERQAVALARALAAAGPAIVADEPFAALAVEAKRAALQGLDRALCGRALLMVTHDEAEAHALGARIVRLAHGALVEACA